MEGTSTATAPGKTPSRESRRSTSAATDWAWARSFAHRQNSTSPPSTVKSTSTVEPTSTVESTSATGALARITLAAIVTAGGQRRPSGRSITRAPASSHEAVRAAPAPRNRRTA